MTTVRTYLAYANKIDPAHILTMADLEISLALSSTLVTFDHERQLVSGLAKSWSIIEPNKVAFTLRDNLKWSDGTPVTAEEYKDALLRAKRVYPDDLKALFSEVSTIDAPNRTTLVITTKEDVGSSGILLKLTEPMYGLLAIGKSGRINLSKGVGPYVIKSDNDKMLVLTINPNWYLYNANMPSLVEIKRPNNKERNLSTFAEDKWANLISGDSILSHSLLSKFKADDYRTWQRSEDKLFGLYPSKPFLARGGADVIKMIAASPERNDLLRGLSGYANAKQFFPRGYVLWSSRAPMIPKPTVDHYNGPIRVLIPAGYSSIPIQEKLTELIEDATGSKDVTVKYIPYSSLNEHLKAQDFEIMATGLAVSDPNFEGAVSFFIERDPPVIQSGKPPYDFSKQVRHARLLPTRDERVVQLREIFTRAQEAGYFLPLFHFSSLAVAKPPIDMSNISNSDETIQFAKLRIVK